MPLERLNPEGMPTPMSYSHVVVAGGSRIVFVAGQVGMDGDGELVGPGNPAAQARQAYRNVVAALAAVGATPADIARLTTYVVDHSAELLPVIMEARREVLGDLLPASTLVGVKALARPEYLIEVEATAVLD